MMATQRTTARRPVRVYADTSVFGGTGDEVFADASRAFFDQVRRGRFQLVISDLVAKELRRAPEAPRRLFEDLLPDVDVAGESDQAVALQQAYLDARILTPNWADDALHVALATVSECAVIVSWNFRHIVNLRRISLYNAINMMNGYRPIEIRSPLEILEYDSETY
jgi:predicted nucleic acid-binding protein